MPQRRNNPAPPEVMTWSKAMPVLVVALVFDALRLMFEWFVFFAPALAALFCTIKASAYVGTTVGGWACSAVSATVGVVGAPVIETLGIVMAMATGFAGWLAVAFILLGTNSRIFKENLFWFVVSLFISEIPLVGSVPAITIGVWRMYRRQINTEKALYKVFEDSQRARLQQEQIAQTMHLQAAEQAQFAEQEVADEAAYEQETAEQELEDQEEVDLNARVTNTQGGVEEIPEPVRKAA